jgi:hypothetical protein
LTTHRQRKKTSAFNSEVLSDIKRNKRRANSIAHHTQVTGKQSELSAIQALIDNGWEVAEPVIDEVYDLVAKTPVTNVWLRVQVKTLRIRENIGPGGSDQLVIVARKSNGHAYQEDEVDVFIGVDGDDVWITLNRGIGEYWKSDNPKLGYEWWLLTGDKSQINPLYTDYIAEEESA